MTNFLMSIRFNKQSPQDFGLVYVNGKFVRESDQTEWMPHALYNIGWGKENGFCKVPLGSFEELMRLVLCDKDLEDSYGAAAMILEKYPQELKLYLQNSLQLREKQKDKKWLRKLNHFFALHKGINLSLQAGMTLAEIDREHGDWKQIANFF
jgi:hypothetical protein